LHGVSGEQLERRIETFRCALRLRSGTVLRIKRRQPVQGRARRATIYFKLPTASLMRPEHAATS
jgi:hypothetical protein